MYITTEACHLHELLRDFKPVYAKPHDVKIQKSPCKNWCRNKKNKMTTWAVWNSCINPEQCVTDSLGEKSVFAM